MRIRLAFTALLLSIIAAPAHAQSLDEVVGRVAGAWSRGDASAIAAFASDAGIALAVDGISTGPVGSRQAAAVLRKLFDQHETVGTRAGRARTAGGSPEKGLGEISWTARLRGTTIAEQAKVVVAFVREDGRWRITEIRLMR